MTPRVSLVMPVRNADRWLDDAIDSVVRQTFQDFECLAIDDHSTDRSPEILSDWSRRDPRIRIIVPAGRGLVAALNCGLDEARGEFLARLDADDRAAPERFAQQVSYLDAHPDVGLLGSWAREIDERGKPFGDLRPPTDPGTLGVTLAHANPFIHSSVMMRTALVRRLGGYRAAFEAAEDYDLWLRLSETMQVAMLPEPLVEYRWHAGSVTRRQAVRQSFSVRLAQRSAGARKSGAADPAAGVAGPPDWRSAAADRSFYAEEAIVYRLLELADRDTAQKSAGEGGDLSLLIERFVSFNHAERELAVQALINGASLARGALAWRRWQTLVRLIGRHPRAAWLAARALRSNRSAAG